MKLLDDYFELGSQLNEYFCYDANARQYIISDKTEYLWTLAAVGIIAFSMNSNYLIYNDDQGDFEEYDKGDGLYYIEQIIKIDNNGIFRGKEFTMIVLNTEMFQINLAIFSNKKEINQY